MYIYMYIDNNNGRLQRFVLYHPFKQYLPSTTVDANNKGNIIMWPTHGNA